MATELTVRLDYLRHCISHQTGAMKAFIQLRAFLDDNYEDITDVFIALDEVQDAIAEGPHGAEFAIGGSQASTLPPVSNAVVADDAAKEEPTEDE